VWRGQQLGGDLLRGGSGGVQDAGGLFVAQLTLSREEVAVDRITEHGV
jgi:hypothetical protein